MMTMRYSNKFTLFSGCIVKFSYTNLQEKTKIGSDEESYLEIPVSMNKYLKFYEICNYSKNNFQ